VAFPKKYAALLAAIAAHRLHNYCHRHASNSVKSNLPLEMFFLFVAESLFLI